MISIRHARILAATLTLGLAASLSDVSAQALRNPPESASGLGLVGARYTLVDDASALSFNPANTAGASESSIMGSFTFIYTEVDYKGGMGRTGKTTASKKYLPNVHALWPVKDGQWVVGLGITTPFGQSTEWERGGPFHGMAPYFAQMALIEINPTLSTKLGDNLAIGVGLDLFYSELDLRQDVPFSAVLGAPVPDGTAKLEGDGSAVAGNIGITWVPREKHKVAAAYRMGFDIDYSGDTSISSIPPPLGGVLAPDSNFDTEVKFPSIVGLGYSYEFSDTVRLGVDVEWLEWSRYSDLPLDLGVNNAAGLFPSSVPQEWKDTWNYGLAIEWDFKPAWALRGGWIYMESPIPEKTVAPTLPDADRHVLTVGLGHQMGAHAVDVAYGYNFFDDLTVSGNQNPAYDGEYDLLSHLFTASYNYSF